jgi:membrane peptidoglycan carboxypeptidase
MLEVYMNIIEWGPNVYGIGEAAEFYFMKRPSDLTLKECLFLATIIPRPKGFMWRFGKDGQVRDFVNRQFRFLSDLMVRRTVLDPVDTMGLSSYPLNITGRATNLIVKTDTLITEPMILDELPGEDD